MFLNLSPTLTNSGLSSIRIFRHICTTISTCSVTIIITKKSIAVQLVIEVTVPTMYIFLKVELVKKIVIQLVMTLNFVKISKQLAKDPIPSDTSALKRLE